jgi:hypothetical protein
VNATAEKTDEVTGPEEPRVLYGRYMLPDMSEHPCQVTNLTTTGATFLTDKIPPIGLTIVAYLEELGRIEAVSDKAVPGGFRISFALKGARLEKLESRIKWLGERPANSEKAAGTRARAATVITNHLPDSRFTVRSRRHIRIGAGITVDVMPSLGTYVMLGKMRGRIVRYLENGVAIEFVKPLEQAHANVAR